MVIGGDLLPLTLISLTDTGFSVLLDTMAFVLFSGSSRIALNFYKLRNWTEGNYSLMTEWRVLILSTGLFSKVISVSDGKSFTFSMEVIKLFDRYSFYKLFRPDNSLI